MNVRGAVPVFREPRRFLLTEKDVRHILEYFYKLHTRVVLYLSYGSFCMHRIIAGIEHADLPLPDEK